MPTTLRERPARKRRSTFAIDEEDIVELEVIAKSQRVSLAWVIRDAIKNYLAERQPLLRRSVPSQDRLP